MKELLIIMLGLFCISCTGESINMLTKKELQDLSTYSLSLIDMNDDNLFPIVECQSSKQNDSLLLNKILEINQIMNTMAKDYVHLTGGIIIGDYVLLNAHAKGEEGLHLFEKKLNKEELRSLVLEMERLSDSTNSLLVSRIKAIMNYHFFNDVPYLNEKRLTSVPFSLLSIRFSMIETSINVQIIEHISNKQCKGNRLK